MRIRSYGISWDHGPLLYRCHCTDDLQPRGDRPRQRCVYANFYKPRFSRDADEWWLAPLIRIELGYDHEQGAGLIEIPFIEHTNGRTTLKFIDRI